MHRSLVGPQSWSGRYGEEKNISACWKSNPDYSVCSLDNLLYWDILFLHTSILRYSTNVCSSHFVALYRGWQYIGKMKHCNLVGILELLNTLKKYANWKVKTYYRDAQYSSILFFMTMSVAAPILAFNYPIFIALLPTVFYVLHLLLFFMLALDRFSHFFFLWLSILPIQHWLMGWSDNEENASVRLLRMYRKMVYIRTRLLICTNI
jgi:hypothetical protein